MALFTENYHMLIKYFMENDIHIKPFWLLEVISDIMTKILLVTNS